MDCLSERKVRGATGLLGGQEPPPGRYLAGRPLAPRTLISCGFSKTGVKISCSAVSQMPTARIGSVPVFSPGAAYFAS